MKTNPPFFASSKTVEHYTPRYIWERAIKQIGNAVCPKMAEALTAGYMRELASA